MLEVPLFILVLSVWAWVSHIDFVCERPLCGSLVTGISLWMEIEGVGTTVSAQRESSLENERAFILSILLFSRSESP